MTWKRSFATGALLLVVSTTPVWADPLPVPFLRQEKNGCGAASVGMVWRYWNERLPGQTVTPPLPKGVYQALYRPASSGIALADMRRYLEDAGFRAYTWRGEWPDLEQHLAKGRPVIVGLKPKQEAAMHFVVVTGSGDGGVWLNDPTRSKPNRLRREQFERQWSLAGKWTLLAAPPAPE